MGAAHQMGWAKIGFSYGYKFLAEVASDPSLLKDADVYKKWIKWVICRAGDTDTNAAISGGLIGAVIGFKRLPYEYLEKIFKLQFEHAKKSYTRRDKEYNPSNFLK